MECGLVERMVMKLVEQLVFPKVDLKERVRVEKMGLKKVDEKEFHSGSDLAMKLALWEPKKGKK